jgi:hypothetical protein
VRRLPPQLQRHLNSKQLHCHRQQQHQLPQLLQEKIHRMVNQATVAILPWERLCKNKNRLDCEMIVIN